MIRAISVETTIYIELGPDGSPRRMSADAAEWLDEARVDQLQSNLEQVADDGEEAIVCEIADRQVRIVRLVGGSDSGYLAAVHEDDSGGSSLADELTDRQLEVAECAADGATAREIGERLDISRNTVKHHLKNIYDRLGIGSRVELARLFDV